MIPKPEEVHWLAAAVALLIGLLLVSELIVGQEVFRKRAWRAHLFPAVVIASSVLLWVITIFSTFSMLHLLAHAIWAQAAPRCRRGRARGGPGKAAEPALVARPRLRALRLGVAFLVHEQYAWLYSRSAFLHHAIGWMLVVVALFPLGQALEPRRVVWRAGFALTFVLLAVLLFADRDAAPIFGRFGLRGP